MKNANIQRFHHPFLCSVLTGALLIVSVSYVHARPRGKEILREHIPTPLGPEAKERLRQAIIRGPLVRIRWPGSESGFRDLASDKIREQVYKAREEFDKFTLKQQFQELLVVWNDQLILPWRSIEVWGWNDSVDAPPALVIDWIHEYLSDIARLIPNVDRPPQAKSIRGATSEDARNILGRWRTWWQANKDRPMLLPESQRRENLKACLADYFYVKDDKTRMEAAEDLDVLGPAIFGMLIDLTGSGGSLGRNVHEYLCLITGYRFPYPRRWGPGVTWAEWWAKQKQMGWKVHFPSHVEHLKKGKRWDDPYEVPAPVLQKEKTP